MTLRTSAQLRAARATLAWTQAKLAAESGVSIPTIKRLELLSGALESRLDTVLKLQEALEQGGVVFIPENGGGAGVREA